MIKVTKKVQWRRDSTSQKAPSIVDVIEGRAKVVATLENIVFHEGSKIELKNGELVFSSGS